ncbi:MAG: rod shape-determining protein RodA [Acidimicrobiales bacterium]|nr:rod shape-determining protein RodA [Acidimicrobiales bacterium]MCB9394282.1 rod shape-determining protein RodA [Acidimicrobiaceae bacterium]
MALTFLQRKPDSGLGNIRSSPSDPSRNVDWVLLLLQMSLAVIGCFVIFSASRTKQVDPYTFVTRQVVFLIAAMIAMVVVMSIDYETLRERSRFFYGVTIMFLVLVNVAGAVSNGARLSFDLGPLRLQPAEFAKATVLLALAAYLAEERSDEVSYPRFLGGLIMVGVPTALIIVQPDLGSASVMVAMAMGVLLVAGAKPKYILLITLMSFATVVAAVVSGIVNRYQLRRIEAFFNQDSNDEVLRDFIYQPRNAIRAIATGGLTGKGWLQGPLTNARNDIPVQWADFPFSAVGEQFGLLGCGVLIGLFALMLLRIWRIAHLSKDMLGTYLCAGVFTMILWQVFQNVAMTIGLMPVTGLPMPFISYGGSGLIAFSMMLGMVQNVHMRRYR